MKRPKSPGTHLSQFQDFLGNQILPGDHVLVFQRSGDTERCWSGQVLDINSVPNPYNSSSPAQIKVLVQATGAYSGWAAHQWPTEKDAFGATVWAGEYPRPTWIMATKIVASPCEVELIPDGTLKGRLQVERY